MPEREVQSLAYWLRAELGYIDFYDRRQDWSEQRGYWILVAQVSMISGVVLSESSAQRHSRSIGTVRRLHCPPRHTQLYRSNPTTQSPFIFLNRVISLADNPLPKQSHYPLCPTTSYESTTTTTPSRLLPFHSHPHSHPHPTTHPNSIRHRTQQCAKPKSPSTPAPAAPTGTTSPAPVPPTASS